MSREELLVLVAAQAQTIESLTQRVVELERRLTADSSNSSRPPSSDPPWEKKSAKKRSSRSRSGRKPGKQPGSPSVSRSLSDDPDAVFEVAPDRCAKCEKSLCGAEETSRVRRQVVDVSPPPPPTVTEYQVVSRRCGGCGHVSEPTATDVPREVTPDTITDTDGEYSSEPATAPESGSTAVDGPGEGTDPGVALVLRPGSPVRIGQPSPQPDNQPLADTPPITTPARSTTAEQLPAIMSITAEPARRLIPGRRYTRPRSSRSFLFLRRNKNEREERFYSTDTPNIIISI
jgi:hypothetical protein